MRLERTFAPDVARAAAMVRLAAILFASSCTPVVHSAAPVSLPVPALATLPAWAQAQTPPTKRALVIGIGDYQHATKLTTPTYDASLVATTLVALDPSFIVTPVPSAATTRSQLLDAISAFAKTLGPGDVAFVYFSGHGLERDGVNYLVPIDAAVATPGREGFVYLSLPYVLESIQKAKPGISVVILDACRVDPFAGANAEDDELDPLDQAAVESPGASSASAGVPGAPQASTTTASPAASSSTASPAITPVMGLNKIDAPDGFLVAYAAEPGKPSYSLFRGDSPGKGSIFTRRLVNFLSTVNKPIFNVFGATEGDVYRLTGKKQKPFLNSFNAGEVLLGKNIYLEADERESWIRTVVETPANQQLSALRGFLDLYPTGSFSPAARKRIGELEQGAAQAVPVSRVTVAPPVDVMSGALRTPGVAQATANVAIASRDVFVRAAPQVSFPRVVGTLRKGDEVQVLAAVVRRGWAKIALPNGSVGYVGSVATPAPPAATNNLTLHVIGDEVPDTTQGPFNAQWKNVLRQSSFALHIDSGPAADPNPWRARQIAFLRALRIRAALVAQGASNARITVTLGNDRVQTGTTIVTATRVTSP